MTAIDFEIPQWLNDDIPNNNGDIQIKNGITRVLITSKKETLLADLQLVITWDAIDIATPTYLYVVYDLLRSNQPDFIDITELERQYGLASFLISRFFPSSTRLNNTSSLRNNKVESTARSDNQFPRIAKGPDDEKSPGFQSRNMEVNSDQFQHPGMDARSSRPYVIPPRRQATQYFSPLQASNTPVFDSRNINNNNPEQNPPFNNIPNMDNSATRKRFFRPSIRPLPLHTERGRPKDMAGYYYAAGSKYTGRMSDRQNLARHEQCYYAYAAICGLNAAQGLASLIVMIEKDSLAGSFYFAHVVPVAQTLEHAFDIFHKWARNSINLNGTLRQWHNLKIATFKNPTGTWRSAMEQLYETAVSIQDQLDTVHKPPRLLIDVLERAIEEEPFYDLLGTIQHNDNPGVFYKLCMDAIDSQERKDRRKIKTTPAFPVTPVESSGDSVSDEINISEVHTIFEAFYASAGRRYGADNRRTNHKYPYRRNTYRRQGSKNPIGRDGNIMTCRGCGSDSHFIRFCDRFQKSKLIGLIMDTPFGDEDHNIADIWVIAQNLPDDVWKDLNHQISPNQTPDKSPFDTVLYNKLSTYSDISHMIHYEKSKSLIESKDLPFLSEQSASKIFVTSTTAKDFAAVLQQKVLTLMSKGKPEFEGIMIDNGASISPSGLSAYVRYCAYTNTKPDVRPSSRAFRGMGHGVQDSKGIVSIRMPIGDHCMIPFEVELVDQDIPLIFGLEQHIKNECSSNEFYRTFTHHPSDTTVPVHFQEESHGSGGHLYIRWNHSTVLYTKPELKKLHLQFGHPSNDALLNLLKRATPDKMTPSVKKTLADIVKNCSPCQEYGPSASRFRVTMPMDEIVFNHEIEIDIFWIDGNPVLHIIDRGTRYSVCKYVEKFDGPYLWNLILEFWITVFTGFPSIIAADRQPAFRSTFFKSTCNQLGIHAKITPTESHNSLSICERYHSIIRRVFNRLKCDFPALNNNTKLAVTTHAVNNTAGPDGLVPTLLLFGTTPRISLPNLCNMGPTNRARFKAMDAARREMETITAQRRVKLALKHNIGPDSPQYEFGDKVRCYREKHKKWMGPYIVHSFDNNRTVHVTINNEIVPLSTSVVKRVTEEEESTNQPPYPQNEPTNESSQESNNADDPDYDPSLNLIVEKASETFLASSIGSKEISHFLNNGVSTVYATVVVKNKRDPRFNDAKKKELQELVNKGTYEFVREEDIPHNPTILQSRFVLAIKNFSESDQYFKARLVILGHIDPDKPRIVNEAPTVLRSSIRMIVALAASFGFKLWSRDISQAFIQSDEPLHRTVFVRPPKGENVLEQIGAPPNSILKAIKPQYGLPESPGYWWQTFRRWHEIDLKMKSSALDPCLFYKHIDGKLEGIQVTQVDDTVGTGTERFSKLEIEKSSKFECKPRTESFPMKFNGMILEKSGNGYVINQHEYCTKMEPIPTELNYSELATFRGKLSYAAVSTRPDVSYASAALSQVTAAKFDESSKALLAQSLKLLKTPRDIKILALDPESIYIAGYADGSFANNPDLSSQLGFIVVLKDKYDKTCIVHYGSWKCRRVTRSVLGSEIYAFSHGMDFVLALSQDLGHIMSRKIDTVMFTDSKSLFDTITKLSTISEKRMLIDVAAIRESYASGELTNVAHILSRHNIANPFTKNNADMTQLYDLMETGYLRHPINQWIITPKE